ncbi:hypothetical protein jhhlp_000573 [Lomentospora prolificans]|uniref:Zn(2)-C6 fungal-type domain-containing protein n=1 Tax=Lomentospora prolificans TaxID=41688 RepID=A0A2N3NLB9_9PEZI|nr:hypothetical protein jhhlp_000573 [Lomentospora prolificans]
MTGISQVSNSPQGFYVFQTVLGSPLQFHPGLGTPELDSLMDAYLPYPASMQEKRATVSVDFLEHYRCTGQNIKFYQVLDYPLPSSASSPSSLQDSGYGSSFTASPIAPTWSWGPAMCPLGASTPSSSSSFSVSSQPSTRRRTQPSTARNLPSSRHQLGDMSHLPGMKILTKDGRDVTNTAPRGCKTKEQRDHAHLMRIMKACDSCRRKKVRCDPSHRTGSSTPNRANEAPPRQAKRLKAETNGGDQRGASAIHPAEIFSLFTPSPSFAAMAQPDEINAIANDPAPASPIDIWDEFISFNDDLDLATSNDFDSIPGPSAFTPTFYTEPHLSATQCIDHGGLVVKSVGPVNESELPPPRLPYLDPNETPHYYADLNLYSPGSTFQLDKTITTRRTFTRARPSWPSRQQFHQPVPLTAFVWAVLSVAIFLFSNCDKWYFAEG